MRNVKKEQMETDNKKRSSAKIKTHILRLYVYGSSPRTLETIANIKKICEENLQGSYLLDIIDLFKQPQLAKDEQIIAVPTLIKKLPPPLRRFIGDLSDSKSVLAGLDLK